jgi:hypothetical protein
LAGAADELDLAHAQAVPLGESGEITSTVTDKAWARCTSFQ